MISDDSEKVFLFFKILVFQADSNVDKKFDIEDSGMNKMGGFFGVCFW